MSFARGVYLGNQRVRLETMGLNWVECFKVQDLATCCHAPRIHGDETCKVSNFQGTRDTRLPLLFSKSNNYT